MRTPKRRRNKKTSSHFWIDKVLLNPETVFNFIKVDFECILSGFFLSGERAFLAVQGNSDPSPRLWKSVDP